MKKKPKARKPQIDSKRTPSLKAATSSTANRSKWIRTKKAFPLPPSVREAVQKLYDAGFVAYVVGGSVRDFLLEREVKDHDIATSATPDEICALFPDGVTVGKAFGVIKFPNMEIATFREDLEYEDFRHPKGVRFSGPIEDARRRDFTVNALFYDPKTARIMDCTDGLVDLKDGVIRAIGNPEVRFREDALRLLRAVRFATTLGFTIEPATAQAIESKSRLILKVSPERIREELTRMWCGPRPAKALETLSKLGLLPHILPELEAVRRTGREVWNHTLKTLEWRVRQNPNSSVSLAWATVLIDVGKPLVYEKSGRKNVNGHEIEGARIANSIGARLRMSRAETQAVAALLEDQLRFREVFRMREATLLRFLREPHFGELIRLHRAEATASDGNLAYYEFCLSRLEEMKKAGNGTHKLVDGTDLIALGFQPGPGFSDILRIVEDLALEGKLKSKDEALEYVVKHFVR